MRFYVYIFLMFWFNTSCLSQHYLDREMLRKVLEIDSSNHTQNGDPFLMVKIIGRNMQPRYTIASLNFLKGAIQIENVGWQSEQDLRQLIIANYEKGFEFRKKKALENLPVNYFSDDQLILLENSESFKSTIKSYIKDLDLVSDFLRIRDNRDSLALFLQRNELFDPVLVVHAVDNYYKFIQLLWTKGIILTEGHNRRLFVHDNDLFVKTFSSVVNKNDN